MALILAKGYSLETPLIEFHGNIEIVKLTNKILEYSILPSLKINTNLRNRE